MQKSIIYKGKKAAYQIFGFEHREQPVLMLVHGFPEDGSIFRYQYEALQTTFPVIIPDLPGSGASASNDTLLSVEDFGGLLYQILETEAVRQVVLVGHSMGGYISLAFAEKYPERLAGLGLLHSTAYADSPEKKATRLRSIDLMEKFGGAAFLKTVIPSLFGTAFKEHHSQVIEGLIEAGNRFETSVLQQYYKIMHDRPDRTAVLKKSKVPVLFIIGSEDQAAPAGDVLPQTALPETALVTLLSGVAHMGFLEAREKMNATLSAFLSMEKIKDAFRDPAADVPV